MRLKLLPINATCKAAGFSPQSESTVDRFQKLWTLVTVRRSQHQQPDKQEGACALVESLSYPKWFQAQCAGEQSSLAAPWTGCASAPHELAWQLQHALRRRLIAAQLQAEQYSVTVLRDADSITYLL